MAKTLDAPMSEIITVFRYGLPRQRSGQAAVEQQISLAHRYTNALIAAERQRREQVVALPTDLAPEARQASLAAIRAATQGEGRALRKTCGVYWGTYLIVEASVDQMRRAASPPSFVRWAHGAGRIGVQLQGGLDLEALRDGTDRRIWIEGLHADRPVSRRHDPDRGVGRSVLHLRVGSDAAGRPYWATWTIVLHRPLPRGGRLKAAMVVRRVRPGRTGADRFVDEVHLTVAHTPSLRPDAGRAAVVAVDLGWRRQDAGACRVAAWADTAGASGTWTLGAETVEASLAWVERWISVLDTRTAQLRVDLLGWARGRTWPADWPERLVRSLGALASWTSRWRYRDLWRWWGAHRFAGDEGGWALVDRWWRGTVPATATSDHGARHLWEVLDQARGTALRRRREQYRIWAAGLVRQAETIVIERFDLRRVAQTDPADAPRTVAARAIRQQVSPSELRLALVQAARRAGTQVVAVSAVNTTRRCSACGSVDTWDQAAEVQHTCGQCGRTADQDWNAAVNLLASWRERPGEARIVVAARSGEETASSAPIRGGRWARLKAAKRDRSQEAGQVADPTGDRA